MRKRGPKVMSPQVLNTGMQEKSLELPGQNTSRHQERSISKAIEDISKLPDKVEHFVSQKMVEPIFQKKLFNKATKKLNVPKSGRIYSDLLDIETAPQISMKRNVFEQKPLDESPLLSDYIQTQIIRTKSLISPPPTQRKTRPTNLLDVDENLNEDLHRFERRFSTQS